MRTLLVASAWVAGIAIFATMAFGYSWLARQTADAAVDDAAVWVFDPHVGPGDTLHLEIKATGGVMLGIRAARIEGGAAPVRVAGRGRHWGRSIRTKSTTRGSDSVDVQVRVPPAHPAGQPLALAIEVESVVARRGIGGFQNDTDRARLTLSLPIRGAAGRWGMRALELLRALLCFAALVWLYLRAGPAINRHDEAGASEAETEGLAYLMLAFAAIIAALGYPIFARPLMAGTGVVGAWFTAVCMVVWGVAPPIVAWRIHKRRTRGATATLRIGTPGTPIAALVPHLARIDASRARLRGRRVTVKRAPEAWIRIDFRQRQLEHGDVRFVGPSALLIEVACAIAEAAGTLTLASPYATVEVRRGADRAALQADWDAQVQAAMERTMTELQDMMARIEALRGDVSP